MATGKAFVPTEIPSLEVWYGSVLTQTADEIVISDTCRTTVYAGSFSYGSFGEVAGTLFSIEEYRAGEMIYSVADVNANALDIYEAIQVLGDAHCQANSCSTAKIR